MKNRKSETNGKSLNEFEDWPLVIDALRENGFEPAHFHGTVEGSVVHVNFYEKPFEVGFDTVDFHASPEFQPKPSEFDSLVADTE